MLKVNITVDLFSSACKGERLNRLGELKSAIPQARFEQLFNFIRIILTKLIFI